MDTAIPNGSDPGPALDKIMSHFVRLKSMKWDIPRNVQGMMILSKAPQSMEAVVQVFAQMINDQTEDQKRESLEPEKICTTMRMSWETLGRSGAKGKQNQQQAQKLSAVKQNTGPPNFQQQQQSQQQQRGDQDARGRGRGRRGKRGGRKNSQQQLGANEAQQQQQPQDYSQVAGPANSKHPPPPTQQWVPAPQPPVQFNPSLDPANPYATNPRDMGYFASRIMAGRPLPPVPTANPLDSTWPTFGKARDLAGRLDVRPSIETLKRLEMAEMAKERVNRDPPPTDPRPPKRARKERPRGEAQGASGKVKDDDVVSLDYSTDGMDEDLVEGNDAFLETPEYNVDSECNNMAGGYDQMRQVQSTPVDEASNGDIQLDNHIALCSYNKHFCFPSECDCKTDKCSKEWLID